jgi:hypothetical protein
MSLVIVGVVFILLLMAPEGSILNEAKLAPTSLKKLRSGTFAKVQNIIAGNILRRFFHRGFRRSWLFFLQFLYPKTT